jgi:hypothetical protein
LASKSSTSLAEICGFAAIASFRYSSVNRVETRIRYLRYARRIWT